MPPLTSWPRTFGLLLGIATTTGCGDGSTDAEVERAPARTTAPQVSCNAARPAGLEVYGRLLIVLPVGDQPGDRLQTATAADGRTFSKVGLYVRGDATVRLSVSGEGREQVDLLGWPTRSAVRESTFRESRASCSWKPYPGGFVYDVPRCAYLNVVTSRGSTRIPFGLGRRCPRDVRDRPVAGTRIIRSRS